MREIEDAVEGLPAAPEKPIEEWTLPELLTENVRLGLLRSHAILSQPLRLKTSESDELTAMDIRLQRVVSDTAAGQAKLLAHIQEADLRSRSSDKGWDELLARLAAAKEKP